MMMIILSTGGKGAEILGLADINHVEPERMKVDLSQTWIQNVEFHTFVAFVFRFSKPCKSNLEGGGGVKQAPFHNTLKIRNFSTPPSYIQSCLIYHINKKGGGGSQMSLKRNPNVLITDIGMRQPITHSAQKHDRWWPWLDCIPIINFFKSEVTLGSSTTVTTKTTATAATEAA